MKNKRPHLRNIKDPRAKRTLGKIFVFGVLEKRWGKLMCAHGHEGATAMIKLPDFPIKDTAI